MRSHIHHTFLSGSSSSPYDFEVNFFAGNFEVKLWIKILNHHMKFLLLVCYDLEICIIFFLKKNATSLVVK